ncbi:MAG: hypothetical protein AAF235_06780, partial [Planctomycetota bacterium]
MLQARQYLLELLGIPADDIPTAADGRIQPVAADELPEPARSLLVHDSDMTSTLEAFHGSKLRLQPLQSSTAGSVLVREVVLESESTGNGVEFGAIRISLDAFEPDARAAVEAAQLPLGAILESFGIGYTCHPDVYFEVQVSAIGGDRAARVI